MKRAAKTAFALCGAVLLCGAKLPLYPLPDSVMPNDAVSLNETRFALPGESLLQAGLVHTSEIILEAPIAAKIDRFETSLAAGDRLTPMVIPSESAQILGQQTEVFCGKEMQSRSKAANAIWGNWFSKYDSNVRFCFADTDNDQKLDRALLGGSFSKEIQTGSPIEPIPYRIELLRRDSEGDKISIEYVRSNKNIIELQISYSQNGAQILSSGFSTPDHVGKDAYSFFRKIDIKNKNLPIVVDDMIGSKIEIDEIEPNGKISYRITKNMKKTMIKPFLISTYTIYVYY